MVRKFKKVVIIIFCLLSISNLMGCTTEKEQLPQYNLYDKTDILWSFTDTFGKKHLTINQIKKIDKYNFEIYFTPKVEIAIINFRTFPENKYGYGVIGCKKFYSDINTDNTLKNQECILPYTFFPANTESVIHIFYTQNDFNDFGTNNDFDNIIIDEIYCDTYYYIPESNYSQTP